MSTVKTDRLGVSKLDTFFSTHGWLFREQHLHDYGIDAQVEIVKNGRPTGELIGLQIKSGTSYFSRSTKTAFVYHTDDTHINYWIKHCLPVIIVLYNPDNDILYWEFISEKTIISTGQGWKINIPKNKHLDENSLFLLSKLTQPPSYIRKLNKLRLDKQWIKLVSEEEVVYIEFEDWIHKSLPRFKIKIGCQSRNDIKEEAWPLVYGLISLEEAISNIVPWAKYEVDEDAYQDYMESEWRAECYCGYDKEDDITFFSETFGQWYKPPEGIVPVSSNGETERYRLILSLNKLGESFLILDDFLNDDTFEERTFSLE